MRVITVAVVASLVGLVGCSDGTSFGSSASSGGKVVDGYLADALVCADENLNRACDAGEPSTITDANGNFRLTGLDRRQRAVPLVMEVQPGTIDLDTNAPPPAGLKYYAPAGSRVISALSTLIQAKIEQEIAEALANNQPVPSLKKLKAEAIADVADDLDLDGVNLLSYDPVALKNNERLSDNVRLTAAKIHVINQVLSQQIADLMTAAAGQGDESATFAAVLAKLDAEDVADAVEGDLAGYALEDFLTTPNLYNQVTTQTAPAVPNAGEIADQALIDADVREALNNLLPNPAPTEPTGGTGGSGI